MVDIVGTDHKEYQPSQNVVDPQVVGLYEEGLLKKRFPRSAVSINPRDSTAAAGAAPSAEKVLDDGHHSYVASKKAGKDIEIEDMGPKDVGTYYQDWRSVSYEDLGVFNRILLDNGLIDHRKVAALLANPEKGAESLTPREIQVLIAEKDDKYKDVWEKVDDADVFESALHDLEGDAGGEHAEDDDDDAHEGEGEADAEPEAEPEDEPAEEEDAPAAEEEEESAAAAAPAAAEVAHSDSEDRSHRRRRRSRSPVKGRRQRSKSPVKAGRSRSKSPVKSRKKGGRKGSDSD